MHSLEKSDSSLDLVAIFFPSLMGWLRVDRTRGDDDGGGNQKGQIIPHFDSPVG